jgi:hypothetical protein
MKLDDNERYFTMNNIKFGCGMVLKLGSKFLYPRLEMINNTSNTLCSNRFKEGK